MLLLEDTILRMVSKFRSFSGMLICGWWRPIDKVRGLLVQILLHSFSNGLFDLSSKKINKNFLSSSKDSLSRNLISHKSDSNTVAALFWKLRSCHQKYCCHQSYIFLKKRKFRERCYVCTQVSLKSIFCFLGKWKSLWMH